MHTRTKTTRYLNHEILGPLAYQHATVKSCEWVWGQGYMILKLHVLFLVVKWEGVSPCSLYPSSPAHTHHSHLQCIQRDIMRKLSMQNWSTPTDKMGDEIHELTTSSVNDCIHVYRIKKHCKQPKQLLNQFNLSEKVHIRIDRYTMYNTSVMHGLLGWAWAEKASYPRPSRGRERKAVQWNQN